jgi:hypothetical protein
MTSPAARLRHKEERAMEKRNPLKALVSAAQAVYYIPFSIWGLVHIRSFMWVTGRKEDVWLVKTVCLLLITVGAVVGEAGRKDRITPEIEALGIGSAASLTAIDVYYVAKGRIRWVYLLDAIGNLGLIAGWIASKRVEGSKARSLH